MNETIWRSENINGPITTAADLTQSIITKLPINYFKTLSTNNQSIYQLSKASANCSVTTRLET